MGPGSRLVCGWCQACISGVHIQKRARSGLGENAAGRRPSPSVLEIWKSGSLALGPTIAQGFKVIGTVHLWSASSAARPPLPVSALKSLRVWDRADGRRRLLLETRVVVCWMMLVHLDLMNW
jgi:hypothetical protein